MAAACSRVFAARACARDLYVGASQSAAARIIVIRPFASG